jgi:hypothetical protein
MAFVPRPPLPEELAWDDYVRGARDLFERLRNTPAVSGVTRSDECWPSMMRYTLNLKHRCLSLEAEFANGWRGFPVLFDWPGKRN